MGNRDDTMGDALVSNLKSFADRLAVALNAVLDAPPGKGEMKQPHRLVDAMRHGLLNGGKRLRPFLVVECASLFGVCEQSALPAACAIECLHSYSLVHDDLPAMDDDDLRRGKPTVHKAYDEATAILAGDALLTLAFDLITDHKCHADPAIRANLANRLSKASGWGGMIGGQVLDLAAETSQPGADEIRLLQRMKTGALIRFSCEAGALLGEADPKKFEALSLYGQTIGLAFQLADDLLDVTSDSETMGKAVGKDADRGKGTLVALYGEDKVRSMLEEAVRQAIAHLEIFGESAETLCQVAQFVAARKN